MKDPLLVTKLAIKLNFDHEKGNLVCIDHDNNKQAISAFVPRIQIIFFQFQVYNKINAMHYSLLLEEHDA